MSLYDRITDSITRRPLLVAFSLTALLQLLAILTCDIRYDTNDDLLMNMICSGFLGGHPDEHLPFSNFVIGKFLSSLYEWNVAFNWYALYLIVTQFISWFILFYFASTRKQALLFMGLTVAMYVFFGISFYSRLQFTTTTILLGVAAMTLFYDALKNERIKKAKLVLGFLLMTFAALIREEPPFLAVALCALPFANLRNLRRNIRPAILFSSLLVMMIAVKNLNRFYYQKDPEWGKYYTEMRSANRFNDNPAFYYFIGSKDMQAVNGWSLNDLHLFGGFFRGYEPVYNLEAYSKMYDSYSQFRPLPVRDFIYIFRTSFFPLFVLLLLVTGFYINRKTERILILLQIILLAGLSWYIYATLQMKERALYAIIFAFCAGVLIISGRIIELRSAAQKTIALAGIAALIVTGAISQYKYQAKHAPVTASEREISTQLLAEMQKTRARWIVWGASLPFESLSPFKHSFTYQQSSFKLFPMTAIYESPTLKEHVGNNLLSLIPESDVRILSTNEPWVSFTPERLDTFYREHLRCKLQLAGDSIDLMSGRRIFWYDGCTTTLSPNEFDNIE